MTRNLMDIIGKRIVSEKNVVMYERFPASDDIQVLPFGRPSPVIDSYLASGWFQLKGEDINLYVKDSENIRVVDPGTPDNSTLYNRFNSLLSGLFFKNEFVKAPIGASAEAVKQTYDDFKVGLFDVGKYLKQGALILAAFLILIILAK